MDDHCHLSTRRRLYVMTDRTVSIVGTICPFCKFRESPADLTP